MAVKIRLARQGAKKRPEYLIVAAHSTRSRDGACLERLGYYYPREADPKKKVKVRLEALNAWRQKGAICSQTVRQLLGKIDAS